MQRNKAAEEWFEDFLLGCVCFLRYLRSPSSDYHRSMLLLLLALTPLDSVVERLQAHYNNLQSLRATFVQVYRQNERAGNAQEETGVVYLQKPGRMRWD